MRWEAEESRVEDQAVRNIGLVLGVDALQGVLATCDRSISKVQCGGSVRSATTQQLEHSDDGGFIQTSS